LLDSDISPGRRYLESRFTGPSTKREIMNIRIGFGLLVVSVVAAACGSDAGSSNGDGNNNGAACVGSTQQLAAPLCDETARTCQSSVVPADEDACNQCLQTAQQLQGSLTQLTTCTCQHCAGPLAACFQSGDTARDGLCRAIVECGQQTGCQGTDCYCGIGVALADCLSTGPMGPCMAQIDAAAAASDGCMPGDAVCVATAQINLESAVGRANAVGACATGNPTATPPAVGLCEGVPNTP
jgi:hypothetical protein